VRLLAESSTRRCKCKIYSMIFNLINFNNKGQSCGTLVGHIHLDKNTFSILFQKGTICSSLVNILFDSDCVHIYVSNLIQLHKQQWVGTFTLLNRSTSTPGVIKGGLVIFPI
jgi:hypothetical protein